MARNLSHEDIRNLPLPDLALKLLKSLDSESNFRCMGLVRVPCINRFFYQEPNDR